MTAVTMHHFSGLSAPFVRSKDTVSGGVFNLLPSPCLHLTILESGTLSGTTWYYHALPQTLIVWQRHFTLTSRRLFLRLRFFSTKDTGRPKGRPVLIAYVSQQQPQPLFPPQLLLL